MPINYTIVNVLPNTLVINSHYHLTNKAKWSLVILFVVLPIIVIRPFVELLEGFDNAQNEYETALLFCLLIALLAIEFVVSVFIASRV